MYFKVSLVHVVCTALIYKYEGETPLFSTPDAGLFQAVFRMPRFCTPDATFGAN